MLRPLVIALALLGAAAPAAVADDAEIFASNNTATITDHRDPRLDKPLRHFRQRVERIIEDGGGRPRDSQLLDGAFASGDSLTFERSRRFDLDRVDGDELHDIAETIRRRFLQASVLTFEPGHPDADAVELEVPGVSARDLREGLLADAEARERLFGGSVTLDRRLLLVASLEDAQFARAFAKRIGGDVKRAKTRTGRREFVEVATGGRARIEKRRLVITGTPESDVVSLEGGRIDFGDDGVVDFEARRFDSVRVDLGEGEDRLIRRGDDRLHLRAGDLGSVESIEVEMTGGEDRVTVDDLTASGTWAVHVELGAGLDRATVNTSDEDEQVSVSPFSGVSVLGPVWVTFDDAEPADRLRVNTRGGDDILSASTDRMKLTLDAGDGGGTLIGGPGDDVLVGGDDFDDVRGGKGDDVAYMGGDFDRFMWFPGDGSDRVDGGASRDSLSFQGSPDGERFVLEADRFTRDVGDIVMDLDHVEVVDSVAFNGADTFTVGENDDVVELNASLASSFGTPSGDASADRITIAGTEGDDDVTIAGKKVFSGALTVTGLPVKLGVSHAEVALDRLVIDTLGGDDHVDTSGLAPDVIGLEVD